MNVRRLLIGSAVLAVLGGCATYDDGYNYRAYSDGRTYTYRYDAYPSYSYRSDSYPSYSYRSDSYPYTYSYRSDAYPHNYGYRYNDGYAYNDRYYNGWFGPYRGPDYSFGFSYRDQH